MKWVKEIITNGFVNMELMQHICISPNLDTDTGKACAVFADDANTERYYLYLVPYTNRAEQLAAQTACELWLDDLMNELKG